MAVWLSVFLIACSGFTIGHITGYFRGRGRVTCPLCEGRGSVLAKGPTINNEKEVFESGFRAGLREGRGTFVDAEQKEADHAPD